MVESGLLLAMELVLLLTFLDVNISKQRIVNSDKGPIITVILVKVRGKIGGKDVSYMSLAIKANKQVFEEPRIRSYINLCEE